MSLIEVVVALALLSTGVMATASAMNGSTRAVTAVDHRSRAVLLAQANIEQLRSIPYDSLGLSASATGFKPTFDSRETVTVSSAQTSPSSETSGAGITYHVERNITWEDVALLNGSPVTGAAKRLTVIVSWPGGALPVRLDSTIAPTRDGVACPRRWIDSAPAGLTGVINAYLGAVGPSSVGATTLNVAASYRPGSPNAIAPGDLIMVIQMTGSGAGLYEYAIATSAPANGVMGVTGIGFFGGLVNSYGADGVFQIVRVPSYGDAAAKAGLAPLPFDGTTGGVLAMDVTGSLSIDATISADGAGLTGPGSVRTTSPTRLLPGQGEAIGAGGGLVVVRAGSLSVGNLIRANGSAGSGGGSGGTVVIGLERGGLAGTTVSARGAAPSGLGGTLLSTAAPTTSAVSGTDAGTTVTDMGIKALVGIGLGVGCEAAVTVSKSTWTPIQTGSATVNKWTGYGGVNLSNIPAGTAPNAAATTVGEFRIAPNVADNYGTRIRALLTAPATGAYRFWIAGDDESLVNLSTDADPANRVKIADVPGWSNDREYTKYPNQKSALINLVSGQQYFIEAFMKEAGGGDNLSVAWTGPGIAIRQTIPGSVLSPTTEGCPGWCPTGAVAPSSTPPSTATVTAGSSETVGYQIVVATGSNRGAATAVTIGDLLPAGFTFHATTAITTSGDVGRPSTTQPTAGDAAPSWGSFSMGPASTITIRFDANVGVSAVAGLTQNSATAFYTGGSGTRVATYPALSGTEDDVSVTVAGP